MNTKESTQKNTQTNNTEYQYNSMNSTNSMNFSSGNVEQTWEQSLEPSLESSLEPLLEPILGRTSALIFAANAIYLAPLVVLGMIFRILISIPSLPFRENLHILYGRPQIAIIYTIIGLIFVISTAITKYYEQDIIQTKSFKIAHFMVSSLVMALGFVFTIAILTTSNCYYAQVAAEQLLSVIINLFTLFVITFPISFCMKNSVSQFHMRYYFLIIVFYAVIELLINLSMGIYSTSLYEGEMPEATNIIVISTVGTPICFITIYLLTCYYATKYLKRNYSKLKDPKNFAIYIDHIVRFYSYFGVWIELRKCCKCSRSRSRSAYYEY